MYIKSASNEPQGSADIVWAALTTQTCSKDILSRPYTIWYMIVGLMCTSFQRGLASNLTGFISVQCCSTCDRLKLRSGPLLCWHGWSAIWVSRLHYQLMSHLSTGHSRGLDVGSHCSHTRPNCLLLDVRWHLNNAIICRSYIREISIY